MTASRPAAQALLDDALTRLAREDGGRVLAVLTRQFGDLDLAEDAVQEALLEATRTWPRTGVPQVPASWLLTVARRRAIDAIRRSRSQDRRALDVAVQLDREGGSDQDPDQDQDQEQDPMLVDDGRVADERLRLMLLCCHPALDRDAQVALVLRLVAGLTTPQIAAAFVVPEPTLAQRLVRAKRKIREARIPMSLPADLTERLDVVLAVLYLVFNEGYLSRGGGSGGVDGAGDPQLQRVDLAREAVRLTRLLADLVPARAEVAGPADVAGLAEVEGLLALQLFHLARSATRADAAGDLVLLADQDRTAWDLPAIEAGNEVLAGALRRMQPGPYQLQAVIASHHANAHTAEDTDWPAIVTAYAQLLAMTGSPVVRLNHAVAVAMADGPGAGLALLEQVTGLDRYHLLPAARADLLRRLGRRDEAAESYGLALRLTDNPVEQRFLRAQRDRLR